MQQKYNYKGTKKKKKKIGHDEINGIWTQQ